MSDEYTNSDRARTFSGTVFFSPILRFAMLRYLFPVVAGCFVLTGCGGQGLVPVSGTLTFKGKPVTNAIINFVPSDDGRPSSGKTDENGKFTLYFDEQNKGIKPGKYKVYVMLDALATATRPGAIPGMPAPMEGDESILFDKYSNEKSPVTVDITKAESDLKLNWD